MAQKNVGPCKGLMMKQSDKILILGASGMVGSAVIRSLVRKGYSNLLGAHRSTVLEEQRQMPLIPVHIDLKDSAAVNRMFENHKPDVVVLSAAMVGGIHANDTYPAQFIYSNLVIQTNVINAAYIHGVERLLFLGSSCIYPKMASQPMKEEYLLTGLLEPTNEPYAVAKIAGIKMCEAYNRQYGTRFLAVMPTNLYGPNDNFDLNNSHVLPALMRRFHEANLAGAPRVEIWGTGSPRREFLHVDDMADAAIHILNLSDEKVDRHLTNYPSPCFVTVGAGLDCTIKELAAMVQKQVGYTGDVVFDTSKPDGAPRKLLDVSRLKKLGWEHRISIESGIRSTYEWFVEQY